MRLNREFFHQDAYQLGKNLLGKILNYRGKRYRIVETEAYGGITDKAAHSYNNRRTKRTEVMYLDGGHLYVYMIYGMYYLLNIVAAQVDNPEAVLIRAIEPLDTIEEKMSTNGPGKLCRHLGIDKRLNGYDLCSSSGDVFIEDDHYPICIRYSKRINIDYAEEDRDRLWRFYLKDNKYVSKL